MGPLMTKKQKISEFLLALGAAVLSYLAYMVWKFIVRLSIVLIFPPLAAPPPAEITEQLVTRCVGNLAFDLPESWEAGPGDMTFFLPGRTPLHKIRFTENLLALMESGNACQPEREDLTGEIMTVIGREDLSNIPGFSAELISSTKISVLRDVRGDDIGRARYAAMSLCLKTPQISLSFEYSESVDKLDKAKVDQIIAENKPNS